MDSSATKVLAIDSSVAGLAGDMLLASLLGLIEDRDSLLREIEIGLKNASEKEFTLTLDTDTYQDFQGYKLNILGADKILDVNDLQKTLDNCISGFSLKQKYEDIARYALKIMLEAEKSVHSNEDVHLHELGTLDTIIDIIGTTFILQKLNIASIQLSPIATGYGSVQTKHGLLPVPAPATDYILSKSGLSTTPGPDGEALTPTAAALLASLSINLERNKNASWKKSSLGFGNRTWKDRGNFVRTRLGVEVQEETSISILESHIDDTTGEILGSAIDDLLEKGALDVSYYPLIMKKGRPAYCLRVLCNNDRVDLLSEEIIKLTGTLGVRVLRVNRHVGQRKYERVKTLYDEREIEFTIKHGEYTSKIEFEDILKLSKELNVSPKELQSKLMSLVNRKNKED
ncbi:MAG: nickel pincer cofactor biosynthesis protein LarC [Candidatus Kariarchaeaceae archaeon]